MASVDDSRAFDSAAAVAGCPLRAMDVTTVQVNLGLRCNQRCAHCHLGAGPGRPERMEWDVMEDVCRAVARLDGPLVDLTGGAPELNPHFRRFIQVLRTGGADVQVRTNLTVLLEPDHADLPEFYRAHDVRLVASMPCYLEENVRAQRGEGVYGRSIEAIRRLNAVGYGTDHQINLVYNPAGPSLPPDQAGLEADYRRELAERFGITFSRLLTIANIPLGRFRTMLRAEGHEEAYMDLLRSSFNEETLDGLMCRHQVSVGWDGTLYDCDFNLALGWPVDESAPQHVSEFEPGAVAGRIIRTGEHCFACTAGQGSSCAGALV